jgi:hypothetical protein
MTKEEKIQNVENYLGKLSTLTSDLKFANDKWVNLGDELEEINIPIYTEDFDKIVLKCLDLTNNYASISCENKFTTHSGKWRSVLDIWRHVKYFVPECTIYDVMRSLFKNKDLLVGHYCTTINRRVFRLKKNINGYGLISLNDLDEFYLKFNDWEDIGL